MEVPALPQTIKTSNPNPEPLRKMLIFNDFLSAMDDNGRKKTNRVRAGFLVFGGLGLYQKNPGNPHECLISGMVHHLVTVGVTAWHET